MLELEDALQEDDEEKFTACRQIGCKVQVVQKRMA